MALYQAALVLLILAAVSLGQDNGNGDNGNGGQDPSTMYGPPQQPPPVYGTPQPPPPVYGIPQPPSPPVYGVPPPVYGAPPPVYGLPPTDSGFTVQTGYEGYLVPTGPSHHHALAFAASPLAALGAAGAKAGFLTKLLPFPFNLIGLKFGAKLGLFLLSLLFLLLIGGALTTAVCAFTPICTISFLGFGFSRETMRSYLTPDRLTSITAFVHDAIDKYKSLQKNRNKKIESSKDNEIK